MALTRIKSENIETSGDLSIDSGTLYVDVENNRVGIGTSSPSTYGKFVVAGSSNVDVAAFIGNQSLTGAAPTYKGSVRIIDNPNAADAAGGLEFLTSIYSNGYGWKISSIDPGSGVHLLFSTRQNNATWSEKMRINSSGNVGIGMEPSYLLDVNGQARFGNYSGNGSSLGGAAGYPVLYTSQQGGRNYETHDFNSYPNLYSTIFINPTGSTNVPSGFSGNGYRFIMGAGDTTYRGFDLVGASEPALWFRERSNGNWRKVVAMDTSSVATVGTLNTTGGISNDSASYLTIGGGTSYYTSFTGDVSIGSTSFVGHRLYTYKSGGDNGVRFEGENASYLDLKGTNYPSYNAFRSYDGSENILFRIGADGATDNFVISTGNVENMRFYNNSHVRIGPFAGSISTGNSTGLEIMNNGGTGDSNVAAISFHCQSYYGLHLHLRHDGYFGMGGWSDSTWRWWTNGSGDMYTRGNYYNKGGVIYYNDDQAYYLNLYTSSASRLYYPVGYETEVQFPGSMNSTWQGGFYHFSNTQDTPDGQYGHTQIVRLSNDWQVQLHWPTANGDKFWFRKRLNGSWSTWHTLLTGTLGQWNTTSDGYGRFYFASAGWTYIKGNNGVEFRDGSDYLTGYIDNYGFTLPNSKWLRWNNTSGTPINILEAVGSDNSLRLKAQSGYSMFLNADVNSNMYLNYNNNSSIYMYGGGTTYYISKYTNELNMWASGVATTFYINYNGGATNISQNAFIVTNPGFVEANRGYRSKPGIYGTVNGNYYNIYWDGTYAHLYIDSTDLGYISVSSDYRIKKNIVDMGNTALSKIMQLRPIHYNFNDINIWKDDGKQKSGFIAHEVQEIIPEAVHGEKDGVDENGNMKIQSLDPLALISILTKALQEANDKIDSLEQRISTIEQG